MSIIDKMLGMMNLNPDEDDYDEYEEEDYEAESSGRFSFSSKKRESDSSGKDYDKGRSSGKILSIRSGSKSKEQEEEMEVCIIRPTMVDDAREITETLLHRRTVVLNMEGVNLDIAQRIIDFTSGSCFAISGNLQKVSNYIFVITPQGVEISGNIEEFLGSLENSPIQTDL